MYRTKPYFEIHCTLGILHSFANHLCVRVTVIGLMISTLLVLYVPLTYITTRYLRPKHNISEIIELAVSSSFSMEYWYDTAIMADNILLKIEIF